MDFAGLYTIKYPDGPRAHLRGDRLEKYIKILSLGTYTEKHRQNELFNYIYMYYTLYVQTVKAVAMHVPR